MPLLIVHVVMKVGAGVLDAVEIAKAQLLVHERDFCFAAPFRGAVAIAQFAVKEARGDRLINAKLCKLLGEKPSVVSRPRSS